MLMLEVVSVHKSTMGANARRIIDESEAAEFTIGRLETCNWVLPQDYVSRVQAVLRFVNNMYFLERKGSTLLAINDRSRPVERNRIVRLSPGDLILIDDIEIQTSEVEAGYVPPRADVQQPVGSPFPLSMPGEEPAGINTGSGDIMDLIGDAGTSAGTGPGRGTPSSFQQQRPPEQGHSVLDNLLSEEPPTLDHSGAGGDEDRWWEDDAGASSKAPSPPVPPRPVASPPAAPRPVAAPPVPPQPASAQPVRLAPAMPSIAPPRSAAPQPPGAAWSGSPQHSGAAMGQVSLDEVLRGAGLDPSHAVMSPEVAHQLGEVLRLVVAGTMEVLKARNDIRRELRIPSTMLAPSKNNPLKFSADVDDALHKLFIQRAAAYLDTVTAFREAFNDIRRHQLALLKSVAVAFDHMLGRFDPKELERQMGVEAGRSGVLGLGSKNKVWEAYAQLYSELQSDHEHTYRKLFGDIWAKAYESELRNQQNSSPLDKEPP